MTAGSGSGNAPANRTAADDKCDSEAANTFP